MTHRNFVLLTSLTKNKCMVLRVTSFETHNQIPNNFHSIIAVMNVFIDSFKFLNEVLKCAIIIEFLCLIFLIPPTWNLYLLISIFTYVRHVHLVVLILNVKKQCFGSAYIFQFRCFESILTPIYLELHVYLEPSFQTSFSVWLLDGQVQIPCHSLKL